MRRRFRFWLCWRLLELARRAHPAPDPDEHREKLWQIIAGGTRGETRRSSTWS